MGLPGETIRKIREALKSAFPNRDELVMMLHMELDIPESEVPNNSNYNLVVFNLIQQLDRQNRIPELIKGALNERPGNPDVQKVAQEINAIDSNVSNESVLKSFEFDVVTVNAQGWKISRKRCRSQYFTEDLGNGVTLEMVAIPGGTFMMGAPKNEQDSGDDERPQHQVTVQPFFMGKYPVTQAQWRAVAALPQVNKELDPNPSRFKGDDRPVERISWYDALEFCARLNFRINFTAGRDYRLPSEAEWEYACRAGTTTPFYFGETITTDLANYNGNYTYGNTPKREFREETTTVGSFPPNAFGLHDMHGNVWEWCADTWHENYEGAPKDGSAWLTQSENDNHLLRGGSWANYPGYCRSAYRTFNVAGDRNVNFGFRVACSAALNQ
ncbi:MAG: formylglycine-generating enzyme family protein [Brasilonema octagenarum HA4186-MV1]|jgi:formylglycine-generating enzyme required for sulfatase activity|nr:formylglycine-generating enzyme family protein [Brasilonema octagenarum HA4186-MV1]